MLRKRLFFCSIFGSLSYTWRRPKLSKVRVEVVKGLVCYGTELYMCEASVTAIDIPRSGQYIHTYMCVSYHNSGHSTSDFSCKSKLFRDISLLACYSASLDNILCIP